MKIIRHKLVPENSFENIIQDTTVNKGGYIEPSFIIIHFTAGQSAESSVSWFKNPAAGASAHLVIGRDGKIYQLIDFNRKAWHAGVSNWANLSGFNNFSIGIELDNPGRLEKVGDKYVSWFKKEYSKENVVEARHKHESSMSYWYEYSGTQIDSCLEVCKVLIEKYKIEDILGHDDISPYRKNDPGPLFPMESFRAKLLGRENDLVDIYEVITNNVNIRRGPGTEYDSYGQLHKGVKVEFLKSSLGWFYVNVIDKPDKNIDVLTGWISGTLLRRVQ